jgi:hypothetical protein
MNRHGARPVLLLSSAIVAGFVLLAQAGAPANADPAPVDLRFWGDGVRAPGADVLSVEVLRDEEPIYLEPTNASAKRGTALMGARLPLFGAATGAGCRGRWWLVGADAYLCEEGGEPSRLAPSEPPQRSALGLPYRYFFVGADGSFGYDELETAEDGAPQTQFLPGFGVAVRRIATKRGGEAYALTSRGFWIPLRDLGEVPSVPFQGAAFSPGLGWIVRERAPLFTAPRRMKQPPGSLPRLTSVEIAELRRSGNEDYVRISDDTWLRASDVRTPALSPPPKEVHAGERWLDVDLPRQTLVAYRGETPVFATLISSGRGPRGSETATPTGTFRIWVKLRTSDMNNFEVVEARENYAIEAVPWVMFFQRGYGLHGTFWHQRFGEVKSHGCINLAPKDAEYLFHFAAPRLAPGWSAVLPTPREPGTLLRIR